MSFTRRSNVCAVVVTFNPDISRLSRALAALAPQARGVVIVDNGSGNRTQVHALAQSLDGVDVIGLSENLGIGAALNMGAQRALALTPDWVLTMDQDTLVDHGAIEGILASYDSLERNYRGRVGILAMRAHPQPSSIWITRYADRLLTIRELDLFTERRGVITSGNLIRADVVAQLHFNESLFIDQVDFDYCYSVRDAGWRVIQQKRFSMDHILGERFDDTDKDHPYENAQRVYYIVRNSTYLVLRRRLPIRFYFVQVVVFSGAFISINGVRSSVHCTLVLARGIVDGALGRMGRRQYRFLQKGRT